MTVRASNVVAALAAVLVAGCVSGNKIRADSEVIKADLERARRSGAMKCAPRELAIAEANLEFAVGALNEGSSFRAGQHIRQAEEASKKAVALSKDCAPKQVLVREGPKDPEPVKPGPGPTVIRIEQTDRDLDGIPDNVDKCPDEAGVSAFGGCADPDPDKDGVAGKDDKCPQLAGPAANSGCPEGPITDKDGDGVPDKQDKCIDVPEDKDGFQDDDGCPDPDNDNDGLVDARDRCPNEPGQIQNLGCPVQDKDGDGITDDQDKCPEQSGPSSTGGCPVLDKDGDGVNDAQDRCPELPGPTANGGCPDGDADGDGVADRLDQCPDKRGPEANKGCPDVDADGDGVVDRLDQCPDKAGPELNKGCPEPDRDGDGIVDRLDKCPDEPEDKDGFEDKDGCPDLDNDQDGLPDAQDQCPNKVGPAENEGCPDTDKDGDGIPDRLDKCPDEYGVKEESGCQKKYKLVVVKKDRIEIKQQIKFGTGSAKMIDKQSAEIISEVGAAMRDNPQIKKLRVEGHTDSQGNDATNLKLSQKRADAVVSALIKGGIDPGRLEGVGYGETKPIASNSTKAGRAENRRTEFNIADQ